VKLEQTSKSSTVDADRFLGPGRPVRWLGNTRAGSRANHREVPAVDPPGYGAQHVEKVIRVRRGSPEPAVKTERVLREVAGLGLGEGNSSGEAE